ncbi:TasA family protein [Neobacillus niacini]|uniref:TasA family protein n=1 Tax=Neobacillus niacini TaxID=86668 RepID=UPI0021CB1B76|nr:TasA family protein [Neobacillus niacini]MCM3767928.1 LPXTG cell wall anchor domain-containing protein [Neobacillus niacini]
MKKNIFVFYKFCGIIASLSLVFLFLTPNYIQATNANSVIDIATTPEKIFIDLTNLKPGDKVVRNIIVQNKGKQDFNYIMSKRFLNGSDIFYNELLFLILDNNKVIYDGKLKDFNKIDPRLIKMGDSEQLIFKVEVPKELGNEYQGLNCEVEFKFYAEGTLGGVLPADGPKLPVTGTNMFNILVVGAVLLLMGSILQFIMKKKRKIEKQV